MIRHLAAGVLASLLAASASYASEALTPAEARIRGCIAAAATAIGTYFRIPAAVLLGVLVVLCFVRSTSTRYTRRLDLDGLIAEQAGSFRTIAAFATRKLRLAALPPGDPRPADPALHPAEWLDRYADRRGGRIDVKAIHAELLRQLGPAWNGPQQAAPHVRVLFAAFARHLAQQRVESLALLGDMAETLRPAGRESEFTSARRPAWPGACFADADAAPVSPPRHTLRLAVAAVLLFGGGYFARGITAQSAGTDIPRPPVAMRIPLISGSLPPGALPIFPQTPSSLPALGGATPRSPTAFAPPPGPTGPPAPTAPLTTRLSQGLRSQASGFVLTLLAGTAYIVPATATPAVLAGLPARQSQCFLPAMRRTTSSRFHLSPRRGARRRRRGANSRPKFRPLCRIVS